MMSLKRYLVEKRVTTMFEMRQKKHSNGERYKKKK
jgi:hypothetical protein